MTTNEIADVIIKNLVKRSFPIFLTTFSGRGFAEADVFGVSKDGFMYEYEIKRSRNEFLNDFKSKDYKHKKLREREVTYTYDEWKNGKRTGEKNTIITIPNRFYFACEPDLISPQELPEYYGLVYITTYDCRVVKRAKLLHHLKANEEIYQRIANILSQRIIYGCSYYTYKHKIN